MNLHPDLMLTLAHDRRRRLADEFRTVRRVPTARRTRTIVP